MTINLKKNSINEKTISASSFLYALKKEHTLLRIVEIKNEALKLINKKTSELPKLGTELKAMIMLFPREERYNALKLLKVHFDIQITSSQIEELRCCLSQDPAFNNLLPFKQKKILERLLVPQDEKKYISACRQKNNKETTRPDHVINTELVLFKGRMRKEREFTQRRLPDIVESHTCTSFRTR